MTDLPLPADAGQRLDPTRPIPPAGQPARLAALEAAVREFTPLVPEIGIVLGSGLGGLADDLEDAGRDPVRRPARLARRDRAGARRSAAARAGWPGVRSSCSRAGSTCTRATTRAWSSQPVLLFQRLGARVVVLTNAAGGLDPSFGPGTLMVMRDHINLTGQNPLMGPNADDLGARFPDLTDAWSPRLRERLHAAGKAEDVVARGGHLRRAHRPELRDPGRGPDATPAWAATPSACRRSSSASPRAGSGSRSAACRW